VLRANAGLNPHVPSAASGRTGLAHAAWGSQEDNAAAAAAAAAAAEEEEEEAAAAARHQRHHTMAAANEALKLQHQASNGGGGDGLYDGGQRHYIDMGEIEVRYMYSAL
jgi:hypothetical protein